MLRITVHRPESGVERLETIEEAKAALAAPGAVLWVDLNGKSAESDAILAQVFGFHPLAIEDVYKEQHRPKVEDYERYVYIIVQGLRAGEHDLGDVDLVELDLFIGANFVVTHHDGSMVSIEDAHRRLAADPGVMSRGAAFLAHAILDRLVDRFLPLGEAYEREIDPLEERVLRNSGQVQLERILALMSEVQHLRRMGAQQKDILKRLAEGEFDEIPAEAKPFFRDVHEHWAEVMESLEATREELQQLFYAFHSLSAYRMNEIMRILTLISTIFLPLTFIAGVYGMNFDFMPELHAWWAYPATWGLFVGISIAMIVYFKRRGWL